VIVAVIAVRMVEMSIHQVVDMPAMRDSLVAAPRSVDVPRRMARAGVLRCAGLRILRTDFQPALVEMIPVQCVHAPVVEIVHMVAVADCRVAASIAVDVGVVAVDRMLGHGYSSFIPDRLRKG
jgi:hypothetical protein